MATRRKKALGKGLGALLGQSSSSGISSGVSSGSFQDQKAPSSPSVAPTESKPEKELFKEDAELRHLPIDELRPNPFQPRRTFNEDKLEELAASIGEHGVLQPLLGCADPEKPGSILLLAGERRWRASRRAGLETVPIRIVEANPQQQLEFALIENVQRDDLNPVEEARAYQELASEFGYSQDQIAKRVGKSRVAVANSLRLLKLSDYILNDLEEGILTAGHARAILSLSHALQQQELRNAILDEELTVRQAEARSKKIASGENIDFANQNKKNPKGTEQNLDVEHLQESLTELLGCKVQIKASSAIKGRIEIKYQSLDDMDRVLDRLGVDRSEL